MGGYVRNGYGLVEPRGSCDLGRGPGRRAATRGGTSIKYAIIGACAGLTAIVAIATVLADVLFPDLRGWELAPFAPAVRSSSSCPFVIVLTTLASRDGLDQLAGNFARERMMQAEAERREFATRLGKRARDGRRPKSTCSTCSNARCTARCPICRPSSCSPTTVIRTSSGCSSRAPMVRRPVARLPSRTSASRLAARAPWCSPTAKRSTRARSCATVPAGRASACASRRDRRPVRRCVAHRGRDRHDPMTTPSTVVESMSHLVGTRLAMVRVLSEREFQASTDPLTGLLNRRMLENHARALRLQRRQFTVAMGDLDLFKKLNDAHGHDTGDRALRAFSNVLRDAAGRRPRRSLRRRGVLDPASRLRPPPRTRCSSGSASTSGRRSCRAACRRSR